MFTEALNAPWLLIILYALPLCASWILWCKATMRHGTYSGEVGWAIFAGILLGAGLALLGAAYLHDVWYC